MADPTPKTPDPKAKGAKPAKAGGSKPDLATLAGMVLAASGILGGMMLEAAASRKSCNQRRR